VYIKYQPIKVLPRSPGSNDKGQSVAAIVSKVIIFMPKAAIFQALVWISAPSTEDRY
jgi:hypothetical protein